MHKIAILDYGSQYTHLIARKIRSLGVYSEILDNNISVDELKKYKGIILSGGPSSVYETNSPSVDPKIFELGIPILGTCYGHQLITHLLGGKVEHGDGVGAEFGKAEIEVLKNVGILKSFEKNEKTVVWMSHGDKVTRLPEGFEILASSKDDPYSVVGNLKKNIYGVQFHSEVVHTQKGTQILSNFIDLTGAKHEWSTETYIEKIVKEIQEQVKNRKVFMLVSGGVDSTVAYALLVKALGQDRVRGFMIDTGLLRKDEAKEVKQMLKEDGIDIDVEDATGEFLEALKNESEPEKKREIIGRKFLEIQAKIAKRENLDLEHWMLGQGTIYPDTIESGATKNSHKIKTHHNRVQEIQDMIEKGLVIEPIKDLYKDEVRELGLKLGLPKRLIVRRPFPGPGLGVRILCNEKIPKINVFDDLNNKINEFLNLRKNNSFKACVLNIKSVGVQGDFRTYKHPVVLYGEASDWRELGEISPMLTNKFSEINRVIYLINPAKLDSQLISQKIAYLDSSRINTLQKIDKITMDWLETVDLSSQVWQMPVVMVPFSIFGDDTESIVLRPFSSEEVMTANFTELDMQKVKELAMDILKNNKISAVFYDITNKPPGTIEWE